MLKPLLMIATLQLASWNLLALRAVADVTVSDVQIVGADREKEPFDQTVTIKYRLTGTYDTVDVTLSATQDGGAPYDIPVTTVSGGFGQGDSTAFAPATTDGVITVTWNLGADWPGKKSDSMKVRVRAKSFIGGLADATSADTSPIFRADTRPIPPLTLKRARKTTGDGRRLITYESAVTGVPAGDSPVFFQAALPDSDPDGFGVFYGYELVKFSDPGAKLYHAIGRASQDPSRQDLKWKPTSFDTLIRIPLNGAVRNNRNLYFKIVRNGAGGKTFRIRLKAKFACFYDQKGQPVSQLDPQKDIVLVFHGRGSGEKNSREINAAMRLAGDTEQVLSVDWSSGAASSGLELTGGRYLRNLGSALRERLAAERFRRLQITTVGHSWGALLSHEVATAWDEGVSRMVVLDPAPEADGYNEKRVNFGIWEKCGQTFGIKGGNRNDGVFGSPNMTRTCRFAVNVLSNDPPSNLTDRWRFYHNLPVDWFIRAVSGGQTGVYDPDKAQPYWDYLRGGILFDRYAIPQEIGRPISAANEFNLVCNGDTSYSSKSNDANFSRHTSFEFKLKDLGWRHVILQKKPNGDIVWKFLSGK
jgi:pimeloyl-ACP methyl ester carboxylesterase